ncbi:uncharacterized protein LOC132731902 [Ruditapes philippinarum]|uniref:uncharacterized protein LOC132731902 n=1 Tax=Ruditapes philippinarum TaxID=129788 RepID=UPI00295A9508|nr:uncharacterized protein LOC132731902 [Ruditapes philippinarum]
MRSIGSLGCLNDDRENRKLLLKLPEWIVTRWNRLVVKWKDQKGSFPPFSEFVNFIVCEAKIACDPITSLQSLKSDQTSSESDKSDRRPRYENSRRPPVRGYSNFTDTKHKTPYVPPNSGISSNCCQICKGKHDLDQCSQFVSRSLNDRKAYIKDNKLCFACLKPNHVSKFCRQRKQCKTCSKFHPTSLHGDVTKSENPTDISKNGSKDQPPSDVKILSNTSFSTSTSTCLKCSMIVPVYVSQKDNPTEERLVYALLDTQSDTTFILSHTCQNLGISGTKVKLLLSTLHSENRIVSSERIKNLVVRPFDSDLRMDIPNAYTRSIMPANRSHIPSPQIAEKWPHLAPIVDKLMPVSNCEVGLLIGYDCSRALLPREIIAPDGDGPYAQRTDLGWGIVGIVGSDNVHSCNDEIGVSHRVVSCEVPHNLVSGPTHMLVSLRNSVKELVNPHEVAKMMELDFSECSSSCDISMSREDQKFISLLQEGIHMTDGHYEMPLPFKDFVPVLPDNRSLALHRLGQLGKRLAKDDLYQTQYTAFIEDMIKKGYAERVPMEDIDRKDGHVWYIPHHGVFHPQKPDKIRVVFDCSAQFKDKSLNGLLLQGPDLISNLIGVLCRFRKEVVAFTCDIQQMFHQFRVNPEHRDFLRFLWWKDGDLNGDVETYHMNVHLFGAVSSPGCSNFALKQVASDYEAEFGSDCASFIRRDFYVDDGLKSVPSVNDAISLINRSKEMCSKAGLHLHKFQSSSKDVLNHIPVDDRSSCLRDVDLLRDDLPVERTLGIQWCVESDTFQFRITLKDNPFSRRGVLSTLSSVYDPLGFLAPVILIGKQLLQQMCRNNTDWDSPLSDDFKPLWERWRHDILQLHSLQVPRCIKPADFGSIVRSELHNFSDASFKGYGQCSYLRLIDSRNHVHCSLLLGKSRVHPLKQTTIPRLELTAAVVSVKVGNLLQLELDLDHIEQWYWTDSNVVLGYISNDSRRFHIFVANRVQEIRNHTEPNQWKFVKSADNPADIASRGAYAQELLESSWFTGPKFLWEPSIPSVNDDTEIRNLSPDDPEVKKSIVHTSLAICAHSSILERIGYFSDWTRAKKAIAVCLRFKEMLVKRSIKRCSNVSCKFDVELRLKNYHPVQVNEVQSAEREIIKLVQKDAFSDEHELLSAVVKSQNKNSNLKHFNVLQKGSPIFKLDPYMDGECIIRVGGRLANSQFSLSEKHPIILPRKGHVSDLILRHFHERVKHQGRGMTINEIRANGFWLLGCSSAVSYLISRCLICRKLRGSLQVQKMANLPSDRLEPTTPFTYSGVDYFGPFYIKEGRKELKRWGVLFTCLCCRAVHVEVACSLDTSSFINALRRFLSIRGSVRVLRSDRGTNFVGAQHELKDAFGEMNFDQIRHFLLNEGCDFQFNMNVPSASHMGGIWERQIRSVRNILSALMLQNGSQLDDEALRTFMCEAAAIVNSRPITVMNVNDPLSAEPLTPNHLLTCKSKIILPPPGNFKRCDLFSRKRWRRIQYLANEFWVRWKREYLHNLQERAKWIPARRNLCVGDVVMIMDENLPRGQWRLGMVSEVFPSNDDLVRKVKVQVGEPGLDNKGKRIRDMSFLERPVHKLILLRETE